jgi:hypothetical protein
MQPFRLVTVQHDFKGLRRQGFRDSGVQSMNAQMSNQVPTTPLGEDLAGAHRAALFVRRFRRRRVNEFLEARIIPERIKHRIEPEQRRSKRHVGSEWTRVRDRE